MKIYFVRHGESEANVLRVISNRDLPHELTERGRAQAQNLASALASIPVTRIYSSPVLRAKQTSEMLSRSLGVEYEITEALREYDCGVLEGTTGDATWAEYNRVLEDWMTFGKLDSKPEQGESFLDMQARFVPFIDRLVRENTGSETIVLVSHGGLYRCMLPVVLANVSKEFAMAHGIPNTAYILAESTPRGLVCLEWCGESMSEGGGHDQHGMVYQLQP